MTSEIFLLKFSFRGRNAFHLRINSNCFSERPAKTFKNCFNYMMYVPSVKSVDMERYAAAAYESLKEVFYKVRVKVLQFAFFGNSTL